MPTDISLKDPRTMKLEALKKFFEHISRRQETHGTSHAFRFKNVLSSRKKGSLRPARYADDVGVESDDADVVPPKRRKRRKPKRHVNLNDTILNYQETGQLMPGESPAPSGHLPTPDDTPAGTPTPEETQTPKVTPANRRKSNKKRTA
jgi:hypothetical protein